MADDDAVLVDDTLALVVMELMPIGNRKIGIQVAP